MTKLHAVALTPDTTTDSQEERMLAALTAQPPCQIKEAFAPIKAGKFMALPSAIHRSLAVERTNMAVMFTSAYGREGAPRIAFHAARSAASQSTGKVLYIHASSRLPEFIKDIENKIPTSLNNFANSGGENAFPFVVLENSGLVCACFYGRGENIKRGNLKSLVTSLRRCFELIVLGGDDMLAGGVSTVFSNMVDGTILVAEAEITRTQVAQKLKQAVEDNGGKVVGAILNRRKYHIPEWIYRSLYGGHQ